MKRKNTSIYCTFQGRYFGKLPDISLSLSETVFNNIGVTVKDADSNEGISNLSYVTDGSFATLDGEEYTYEIYTPGYCFAQGKVSGEALKRRQIINNITESGCRLMGWNEQS